MTNSQLELFPPLPVLLNESRGVVDIDQLPGELQFDPEKRINIAELAGRIGVILASPMPRFPGMIDRTLEVYPADFNRSDPMALTAGLIIPRGDPRYKHAKSRRIAVLADQPLTIYGLPGVQRPDVGVALGPGEYTKIAHYPRPLAARSIAVTLDAREKSMNREETKEAALRAAGHILEDKIESMEKLDERFIGEVALLGSLHRDARIVWRTAYLGKNLNRQRLLADELIQGIVEVAATGLEYSTADVNAAHRAFTSRLYRSGSAREIAASWRSVTVWAARYINAKRGKVNQSLNGSRRLLRTYQPYLDKRQAELAAVAGQSEL